MIYGDKQAVAAILAGRNNVAVGRGNNRRSPVRCQVNSPVEMNAPVNRMAAITKAAG